VTEWKDDGRAGQGRARQGKARQSTWVGWRDGRAAEIELEIRADLAPCE